MTREEAKRRIECCRNFLANNYSDMGEPNFTAFKMAIKALSAESCEDCISREEVKNMIRKLTKWSVKKEQWVNVGLLYDDVMFGIDKIPSVQPSYNGCDYYDYEAKTCRRSETEESNNCISREAVMHILDEIGGDYDNPREAEAPIDYIADMISDLPSVQPKEIYNKGWKDGSEATAYHVELCEKENPTIPMSVIEDIKAEIANTVLEESKQCDGDYAFLKWCAGLKYSLRIIDKHIEDIGGK